jgi:WD40 repeat protein
MHKLEGHTNAVLYIEFSPDGKKIVTGGHDELARIWDIESGKELLKLKGRAGIFFPDGKRIATVSWEDNRTRIWNTESGSAHFGQELQTIEGGLPQFLPGGKKFATIHKDETIRIWDTETGKELQKFKGEEYFFSHDDKKIATQDGYGITIWDVESGKELYKLDGQLWDTEPEEVLHKLEDFFVRGKPVVAVAKWHYVRSKIAQPENELVITRTAVPTPDGKRIIAASRIDETFVFKIWDTESGKELHTLKGLFTENPFVFSPDGKKLITISWDETSYLQVWDVESGKALKKLGGYTGEVFPWTFSPDGKKVVGIRVSDEGDGTVRIWILE